MLTYEDLAQAASQNDDLAERDGLEDAISAAGASAEAVVACARQRAMRAVLIFFDRPIPADKQVVFFSDEEHVLFLRLLPGYLDGIAIGLRAAKNQQNKE